MPYALLAGLLALGVFIGMVILQEVGRRVGHRRMARDPEGARAGVGAIDGAVFGLLGLLVAFTFSGAASRFDARRQLVVEEANAIGTAYLRLDVLPHERSRRSGTSSAGTSRRGSTPIESCPTSRRRRRGWPGPRCCKGRSGARR